MMDISVIYNPPTDPRERLRQLQELRDTVDREIDETVDVLLGETAEDLEPFDPSPVVGTAPPGIAPYRCTRTGPVVASCRHADCKPPPLYKPHDRNGMVIEGPNGPIAPR